MLLRSKPILRRSMPAFQGEGRSSGRIMVDVNSSPFVGNKTFWPLPIYVRPWKFLERVEKKRDEIGTSMESQVVSEDDEQAESVSETADNSQMSHTGDSAESGDSRLQRRCFATLNILQPALYFPFE